MLIENWHATKVGPYWYTYYGRTDFSKNWCWETERACRTDNIQSASHTCTRTNSKWIKDLNVKKKKPYKFQKKT